MGETFADDRVFELTCEPGFGRRWEFVGEKGTSGDEGHEIKEEVRGLTAKHGPGVLTLMVKEV